MKYIKKLFIIFALTFSVSNLYACYCMPQIDKAFDELGREVEEAIDAQIEAITKDKGLIDQIKKNTEDIEAQNDILAKLIAGEKKKALQNYEILFMIEKIIELKNTGEMR